MELECPACSRRILNRRLLACEFCGAALPEELRMGPEERRAIAEEHAAKSAEQRRRDGERWERERRERRRR